MVCNINRFSLLTFSLHPHGLVETITAIFNTQFDGRSYYLASNTTNTARHGFVAKLLTKEKVNEENRSMLLKTLCIVRVDFMAS